MKQEYFKHWVAATVFCFLSTIAISQDEKPETPRWVSDKGYWVVESNINDPMKHVIRFYFNDNTLIYTEELNGVKFNPGKKRVRIKLKKVLESSVLAWEQKRVAEENKSYVAAILK